MRRTLMLLLGVALAGGLAAPARANQADRDYIAKKFLVVYLPRPNDAKSVVTVNAQQVASGGSFTPDPAKTGFRDLLQSLYAATPARGLTADEQERLQAVVAATLRITEKTIRIVLVNDDAGPITNAASQAEFSLSCTDHTDANGRILAAQRIWPTAMVVGADPGAEPAKPWGGSFSIGSYRMANDSDSFPSFKSAMWTVVHELTHTQDLSYMRWMEFRSFHYGGDGSHYFTEACPSIASAYKEGLANFVAWWFARDYIGRIAAWHGTDGDVLVEKAPSTATSNDPADVFFYKLLDASKSRAASGGFSSDIQMNYGVWHISELPPRMVVHNEQIIALVLFYRAMATANGFNEVMDTFKKSNPGNHRVSASAWARLIDSLSTQLLPAPLKRADVARTSPQQALLVMALCDYFTGFRAKDQAELASLFEDQAYIKDWVVAYDTSGRAAVRAAVQKWESANPKPPGDQEGKWFDRITAVTGVISTTVGLRK
jgi:hypothetical protein